MSLGSGTPLFGPWRACLWALACLFLKRASLWALANQERPRQRHTRACLWLWRASLRALACLSLGHAVPLSGPLLCLPFSPEGSQCLPFGPEGSQWAMEYLYWGTGVPQFGSRSASIWGPGVPLLGDPSPHASTRLPRQRPAPSCFWLLPPSLPAPSSSFQLLLAPTGARARIGPPWVSRRSRAPLEIRSAAV